MVYVDTREKKNEHIVKYLETHNIPWEARCLSVGDYMLDSRPGVSIDKKAGMEEVYGNLTQSHDRFVRELIRARADGVRLVVLIEETRLRTLEDVKQWRSWRAKEWDRLRLTGKPEDFARLHLNRRRPPLSGAALHSRMAALSELHGVEWRFCRRQHTGEAIMAILGEAED